MFDYRAFTENIGTQFRSRSSELVSFFCREDYEAAITRYKKAKKDSRLFRKNDLDEMCKARGIDGDELLDNPALLFFVPTRSELQDKLLTIIYDMYPKVPNSAQYMDRLVRKLAPEYSQDSVRVAILKKFVLGEGLAWKRYNTSAIIDWAVARMSDDEKKEYNQASEKYRLIIAINKLDDSVFSKERMTTALTAMETLHLIHRRLIRLPDLEIVDAEGKPQRFFGTKISDMYLSESDRGTLQYLCANYDIPCGDNDLIDDILLRIHKYIEANDIIAEDDDHLSALLAALEKSTQMLLDCRLREALSPLTHESLQTLCEQYNVSFNCNTTIEETLGKMIELLQDEASSFAKDDHLGAFVTSLEKDFKKFLRSIPYKTKKNTIAKAIGQYESDVDDAIEKKSDGKWELLKLCDDLSKGNFRTGNGQTRVNLYHFAIMFGMSVALRESDEYNPQTDIEKNLFEDYYSDNMIRFLDDSYNDKSFSCCWEREPRGDGINYKNFAEIIYIYYIYRTDLNLSGGERIARAERLINSCMRNRKKQKDLPLSSNDHTRLYRQRLIDFVLDSDEKHLPELIINNFKVGNDGGTRISNASSQNTAYDIFDELISDIETNNLHLIYDATDVDSERADIVDQFVSEATEALTFNWKLSSLLKEKYAENKAFIRVINNLNDRLSQEFQWIGIQKKNLLTYLLHELYHHTDEENPMRGSILKERLQKKDITITGETIRFGANILHDLGFDVHRVSKNNESRYYLGLREYTDAKLNKILILLKNTYCTNESRSRQLFAELLSEKNYFNKKITRTMLISVYTHYYIYYLVDSYSVQSFPQLYDDFIASINPVLEKARFQPLNEKNILDMFVIVSLYLYFLENGR